MRPDKADLVFRPCLPGDERGQTNETDRLLPISGVSFSWFSRVDCSVPPLSAGGPSAVSGALPSASLYPQGLAGGLEEHISRYGSLGWLWGLPSHFPSRALLTPYLTGGRCQVLGLPPAFL